MLELSCINLITLYRPKTPHNKVLANLVKKRAASETLSSSPAKKSTQDVKCSSDKATEDTQGTDFVNLNDNTYRNGILREIMGKFMRNISVNYVIMTTYINSKFTVYPSAMQCVGVLPGIGSYISDDSSESEATSGSEVEEPSYDLRGHKVQEKK